jgi:hypothetical protein
MLSDTNAVRHEGVVLPFRVFNKIQTVASGAIVENLFNTR